MLVFSSFLELELLWSFKGEKTKSPRETETVYISTINPQCCTDEQFGAHAREIIPSI